MSNSKQIIGALTLACLTTIGSQSKAEPSAPLVLRADNTVIVDGTHHAGKYLQWILLKCVANEADADALKPGIKPKPIRNERSTFPLYRAAAKPEFPPTQNIIAIGKTRYLTEDDRKRLAANPGAMLLRRTGNVLIVAGETAHAPKVGEMAVLSLFLNRVFNIRFYAPSPLWWATPESDEITINDLDVFQAPKFAKTTWSGRWWPNYPHEWDRLNLPLSEGADLRANHAIINYFNPDKYYDTHPELYEMKRGKRPRPTGKYWNPCLSAKALPDVAMGEIRQIMAKKSPRYLAFGVMDCQFDCHCEPCQTSVKKHDGQYSNLYYSFLNKVARQCQKEFPELYLTSYIYSNVKRPPVGMTIEPNIVVDYVSKTYQWVNPKWSERVKADILSWANLGAGWVIHDWSFGGITPRSYTRQFAQFLQWGHRNGMKGLYIEWSHFDNWHLDGARYWIMRQLETDPYQDVDALWRQYCDDMYGAGSEPMYRLFQHFADKATYANDYCDLEDWPKREFALYTETDLVYQRDLIKQAQALVANDSTARKRLDEFLPFFRQHELWVQAVGEPSRLAHQHENNGGINKAALAFYLNDDGSKLDEAIAFYRQMRQTDDPGTKKVYQKFEFLAAYAHNYSRAMGQLLRPLRQQAISQVNMDRIDATTPSQVLRTSQRLLQAQLPKNYKAEQLKHIQGLLDKSIWVAAQTELPKIDGKLDDAAWEHATELTDFSIRAVLQPSQHKTSGHVMRVKDQLVFGIRCEQLGPIWAETGPEIETGTRIWRESSVEFFFGPHDGKRMGASFPFAQYIVNAHGAWRGFAKAKGNRTNVTVAVHKNDEAGYYTIEAAFPLRAEGYDYTQEPILSFNLMRNVYNADTDRASELIGWAPIFYTARDADSRGLIFVDASK